MYKSMLCVVSLLIALPATSLAVCEIQPCDEQAVDTDGDGLSDVAEMALGTSLSNPDTDYDGHSDYWEVFVGGDPLDRVDRDLLPSDEDLDNDGIPDVYEGSIYELFRDADSDGMSDALESGFPDSDNDGIVDELTDENFNGIPDVAETGLPLRDTDGDGVPDFRDGDSDQDGIRDQHEYAVASSSPGLTNPIDPDGDGLINSIDLDSDGDGVFDIVEAAPRSRFDQTVFQDLDADGKLDELQDRDADGIMDHVDTDFVLEPFTDDDGDGIVDFADLDYLDAWQRYQELTDAAYLPADPYLGLDNDRDGVINSFDRTDNGVYNQLGWDLDLIDADGDGINAWLDADEGSAIVASAAAVGGGGAWCFFGLVFIWIVKVHPRRLLRLWLN